MKNILLKFFLIFAVFFQIELVAEEKNYHKELIDINELNQTITIKQK